MERGLNKAYARTRNSRYWAADGTSDLQRNTVSIDTVPLSLEGYREWQQEALTSIQPSVGAAPPPPPTCNQHSLRKKKETGVKEHRSAEGAEEKFVVPTTSMGNFAETPRICVVNFAVNLKHEISHAK